MATETKKLTGKKFYITTPIYYGTGKPHLGTLYTTVLADVIARWKRLDGYNTFFLTGTDEHGHKIAQAAAKAGMEPKAFVDQFVADYKKAWSAYHIEYSKFIRTTDSDHKAAVIELIKTLQKNGDIYKGTYSGWYCVPDETFVPGSQAAGEVGPVCPTCGRTTEYMSEPGYFFRLSAYQDRLLEFFKEHANFIVPHERMNEVVAFVQAGLKDFSISRSTVKWGIPFPGDDEQVLYVWADALTNYISAVGYGDQARAQEFDYWWPADVHLMAKEIVRFHAIYWIAFLMAARLPFPRQLLVHGWLVVDGRKMSKSFGNVIDPMAICALYGPEPVRYYLAAHLSIAQDASASIQDLETVITNDLANEFGNLLNRVLVLAQKNGALALARQEMPDQNTQEVIAAHKQLVKSFRHHMDRYEMHLAYAEVKRFVGLVNAYVHARQPWVQAKQDMRAFLQTIYTAVGSLNMIAHLLWPTMPETMERALGALGVTFGGEIDAVAHECFTRAYMLTVISPLFEKVEGKGESVAGGVCEVSVVVDAKEEKKLEVPAIEIGDLDKVHLVVGTILSAETVSNSDKLLKLMVDCGGYGTRQILAGVRAYFEPDKLAGQQALFVLNLKPRMMRGLESQGMLFVASGDGAHAFMQPFCKVPAGTRLR